MHGALARVTALRPRAPARRSIRRVPILREPSMPDPRRYRILACEFCEDGTAGGSHQALFDTVRLVDRQRFEPVVVFYEDNRFVATLARARDRGPRLEARARDRARAPRAAAPARPASSVIGAVRRRVRLLRDAHRPGAPQQLARARLRRLAAGGALAGDPSSLRGGYPVSISQRAAAARAHPPLRPGGGDQRQRARGIAPRGLSGTMLTR